MNMRERIAELARKFHSESCYPDASDFEVDAFIGAVFDALSNPTPEMLDAIRKEIAKSTGVWLGIADAHEIFVAAIRKAGEK